MSKVFIIDDDLIHQRIGHIMIEKHKIFDSFEGFTEALVAFNYIKKNINNNSLLPDVILLDLNMPNYDGWDFLDEYRSIYPLITHPIKIYIVTSSVDEKDKNRSETYPFVSGFISKPLSPEIIKNTLNL